MDNFFSKEKTIENKPEYGSKEYMRLAAKKHYDKCGKQKGKDRYYVTKYGKETVNQYKTKYGDDYITMLKIDKLKLTLSDSNSENSESSIEDNFD